MFVAQYRRTMAGARRIVEDTPINLRSRKQTQEPPPPPVELVPSPEESMAAAIAASTILHHQQHRLTPVELAAYRVAAERRESGRVFRQSYERIEARTLKLFGIKRAELRGPRRDRKLCFARQFHTYWCCRLLPWLSLPQIGRRMGRDHTTVLHNADAYVKKRKAMGRYLLNDRVYFKKRLEK